MCSSLTPSSKGSNHAFALHPGPSTAVHNCCSSSCSRLHSSGLGNIGLCGSHPSCAESSYGLQAYAADMAETEAGMALPLDPVASSAAANGYAHPYHKGSTYGQEPPASLFSALTPSLQPVRSIVAHESTVMHAYQTLAPVVNVTWTQQVNLLRPSGC